jgi:hypothetical protein
VPCRDYILEDERNVAITISYNELKMLRDELERAMKKTDFLRGLVEKSLAVPTIVYDTDW